MVDFERRIEAEYANISRLITLIPDKEKLPDLSFLELAGLATLVHNFYHGIENIIKQCLLHNNIEIPSGSSWHKDLLIIASQNSIISNNTLTALSEYLAFRHFFSHAYALDLNPEKMEPLVENMDNTFKYFKSDINEFNA